MAQAEHKSDIPALIYRGNITNSSEQFPCIQPFLLFHSLPEFKRVFFKTILAESLIKTAATTKNYTLGLTGNVWLYKEACKAQGQTTGAPWPGGAFVPQGTWH